MDRTCSFRAAACSTRRCFPQASLSAGVDHLPGHAWERQALYSGVRRQPVHGGWSSRRTRQRASTSHRLRVVKGSHRQLCHKTPEPRRARAPSASSGGSLVSLQLFGHPFSSYTWKVLIALWADETPFGSCAWPPSPRERRRATPPLAVGQFPLLVDGDRSVPEQVPSSSICGAPSRAQSLDSGWRARAARSLFDRVFDLRVMANMQAVVSDALRPQSIETLLTAALRANGSAQPTTGLRQIWTSALGPLASSLCWLIVGGTSLVYADGSRRSTKGIHS